MSDLRKAGLFHAPMLALVLVGVFFAGDALAQRQDKVLKGDAQCTRCHDETEEYPVLAIAKTKHGTLADGRTPTCTSCHGVSDLHVNRPPDAKERPKPDRSFSKTSKTPIAERNQACLACHQGGNRIHWQMSMHAGRDVACTSCHDVHTQHDKVRDKDYQAEACFACHKEVRAQVNRPSRHPIREGKVVCADCHNPHGTAGEKMLLRDSVNDTCYTCHMEKRGPFVRTHAPVQENCAICHNPHGTANDNLLKVRAPWLCQQCHEPTSHRGNLAGFEPGTGNTNRTRGITQARSCLNCHTNIHGTNNVFNDSGERSFRR
ncbi:MAG TPA: DmsE family decaheme c-type cytochrome [Burkholderiales bacterium]|nr:DmsE family decaheme c-type cytochrome [Burkholderiales bacterium]